MNRERQNKEHQMKQAHLVREALRKQGAEDQTERTDHIICRRDLFDQLPQEIAEKLDKLWLQDWDCLPGRLYEYKQDFYPADPRMEGNEFGELWILRTYWYVLVKTKPMQQLDVPEECEEPQTIEPGPYILQDNAHILGHNYPRGKRLWVTKNAVKTAANGEVAALSRRGRITIVNIKSLVRDPNEVTYFEWVTQSTEKPEPEAIYVTKDVMDTNTGNFTPKGTVLYRRANGQYITQNTTIGSACAKNIESLKGHYVDLNNVVR